MSHGLIIFLMGLGVAAVGALIFFGGTKLIDRQNNAVGGFAACFVALFGAVVIFVGMGLLLAAFFVR